MEESVRKFLSDNGKKGGSTTRDRHPEHLKKISALGVAARKAKKLQTPKS